LTTNAFRFVAVSTKATSFDSSTAATTQRPSGEMPTPSGGLAELDLTARLAADQVDQHQLVAGLVADIGGPAVLADHDATRLLACRNVAHHLIGCNVDDAERAGALVGNVGERRAMREAGQGRKGSELQQVEPHGEAIAPDEG
jgi:hypothetical protein